MPGGEAPSAFQTTIGQLFARSSTECGGVDLFTVSQADVGLTEATGRQILQRLGSLERKLDLIFGDNVVMFGRFVRLLSFDEVALRELLQGREHASRHR
jgi:hypothetical protein